jgi:hypothetical protein
MINNNKDEVVQKHSARLAGGCTLLFISPISKFRADQNLIDIKQCHCDFFFASPERGFLLLIYIIVHHLHSINPITNLQSKWCSQLAC